MTAVPLAVRIAAPLAAGALLAAGCSGSTAPSASGGGGAAAGSVAVDARTGPDGTYLTDGSGRTLYLFLADKSGASTCSGACATAWPPLTTTSKASAGGGVTASDLGTVTRSDGTKQVTYNGHPLYYFARDTSAGRADGQGLTGFGAAWWIVSPVGMAITMPGAGAGAGSSGPAGGSSSPAG
jgi:predicted lipoprotein with Yx(FWY)xxD motif